MNILLIQPFTDNLEPPLSLAFLAAALEKEGHRAQIIDLQISHVRKNWQTVIETESADLIGITAMTPQIKQAHEIAKNIKSHSPSIPIVVGGAHPTLLPEQTLLEFGAFDILVIGEGERTAVELVHTLEQKKPLSLVRGIAYRVNGEVVKTESRPRMTCLDDLPNPHLYYDFKYYLHHNSFGFTDKSVSMIVSRGCPFSCRFCATKTFWSRKYICKSTDGVIQEIRGLLGRGAEGIVFRDSTFNVNKKWIHEFCEKILKERLSFKWAINARVNLVDYEQFSLMRKAGLDTVYFGVESGSQKMLDFYGKGINLQETEKAFEICRKLRIHTGAYFMLGALPETRKDMDQTYQFVKRLKPTFSLVFIFMPLPGSELYQYYIDQGYCFDYNNIRSDKAVFRSAGLTLEELESIRSKWYEDFNRKPNLLIRSAHSLREIQSWNDVRHFYRKGRRHLLTSLNKAHKLFHRSVSD